LHYKLPPVLQAANKQFQILSYFDFIGAADPVVFLVIFYDSRVVRRVLHSSTVEIERKYLNAAKSSSKALLLALLLVLAIGTTMTIFN
jgi:hypothetical protein